MKKLLLYILLLLFIFESCKKTSAPKPPPDTSKKYTITATTVGEGSIDPPGVNSVSPGSSWTYTINPNANFGTLSLSVDGAPVIPAPGFYTFLNVDANHTIKATFSAIAKMNVVVTNGISTLSTQPLLGGSLIVTFLPNPTFHTDSLYVNGTFIKLLNGALTYTVSNISANETIRVTCTDVLSKKQLDSLSNLLIGNWMMTSHQSKLGAPQDTHLFSWGAQPTTSCGPDDFDQFFADGRYVRDYDGYRCAPLTYEQFKPYSPNHWKLKNNGKVIFLTDPLLDSLTNVTITKDSLIAFYSPSHGVEYGRISYWYHYARKP